MNISVWPWLADLLTVTISILAAQINPAVFLRVSSTRHFHPQNCSLIIMTLLELAVWARCSSHVSRVWRRQSMSCWKTVPGYWRCKTCGHSSVLSGSPNHHQSWPEFIPSGIPHHDDRSNAGVSLHRISRIGHSPQQCPVHVEPKLIAVESSTCVQMAWGSVILGSTIRRSSLVVVCLRWLEPSQCVCVPSRAHWFQH